MRPETKVYISAKLEHSQKLLSLKKDGFHFNARWPFMAASAQQRMVPVTHWQQENYDDIETADYFILYVEPGDHLKGSLQEYGYALRAGKYIWIAGDGHGVDYTPPDQEVTLRVPHKDVMPFGLFRQQTRIVLSLDQAFKEIKALHGSPVMNSEGISAPVPRFHTLGDDTVINVTVK